MIDRTCQQCGTTYRTFPSIRPKYCGSACAGAAKRNGENVACAQCGEDFYRRPSQPNQTYCSKSCARTAANLTDKNPSFSRDISGDKNPMFGKGMSGEDNPMFGMRKEASSRWRGGTKSRPDGYIRVVAHDDHPYPCETSPSGTKYVLAHRFVVEQWLGRYLEPGEVVHHKDENPSNNDISNLVLYASQSEHMRLGHPDRCPNLGQPSSDVPDLDGPRPG
jgi:hypothetical protein